MKEELRFVMDLPLGASVGTYLDYMADQACPR